MTLRDDRPDPVDGETRAALEAGGARLEFAIDAPIEWGAIRSLVPSPGIPESHPIVTEALERGVEVISEIELGHRHATRPLIAITGTNGKSTTTALTAHLLNETGRAAIACGNIGEAFCDALLRPAPDVYVVEVSSYQLERVDQFQPAAAAVLNLAPDHLARHGTVEEYYRTKARVAENMRESDALALNRDDRNLPKYFSEHPARRLEFSLHDPIATAYLEGGAFRFREAPLSVAADYRVPLDALRQPGRHNQANAMAAMLLALALYPDTPPEAMALALSTFAGIPHRLEFLAEIDGVRWFNDSKATNLDALMTALAAFEAPITLIAGGVGKGEDWAPSGPAAGRKLRRAILIGESRDTIRAAWGGAVECEDAADLEAAVARAAKVARPGEIVLLSPGCASFDAYKNFEQRGDHFLALVEKRLTPR